MEIKIIDSIMGSGKTNNETLNKIDVGDKRFKKNGTISCLRANVENSPNKRMRDLLRKWLKNISETP